MKTLEQLRELFVSARNIAKEASPDRAAEAAEYLKGISDHCKELYDLPGIPYMDKAKCINLYTSIDNVISILKNQGFCNETVAAFFGLGNAKGLSFSDVSAGRGYIKNPDPPASTSKDAPIDSLLGGDEPTDTKLPSKKLPLKKNPPSPAKGSDTPKDGDDVPPVYTDVPADNGDGDIPLPMGADSPEKPSTDVGNGGNADTAPIDPKLLSGGDVLEPKCFDDFIGQPHIVNRLKDEIAAAKIMGKSHIDHIMLFGNRGLGKSTLMKIIANELGVSFEFIDCTSLRNDVKSQKNFNEFFVRLSQQESPVVIGLDEIHALPEKIQSNLLTLLADGRYNYLATDGTPRTLTLPEFTFIGATTDYDAVLSTLKDRCSNLTFFMRDYTRDELTKIFINKLSATGLSTDATVCTMCVNRCRSSIRDVTAIIKGLRTKAIISNTSVITPEMASAYFAERGMDEIGLKDTERKLLRVLADDPSGSMSEETLAARLYLDPKILTKEYEPFLLKIGLISINARGRCLTAKADDYLKYGYFRFDDGTVIGSLPDKKGDKDEPDTPADPENNPGEPTETVQPDINPTEPAPHNDGENTPPETEEQT